MMLPDSCLRTSGSTYSTPGQALQVRRSKTLLHNPMMRYGCLFLALATLVAVEAFVFQQQVALHQHAAAKSRKVWCNAISTSGMWNAGLSYGKGQFRFYNGFDEWIKPFPQEDRDAYPEIFNIPKGVYEVSLPTPLGIVFEEIDAGRGVYVTDLVEGGSAERQGIVKPGDILIAVTAVKVLGAKWERRLIPAQKFDFDTVVGAIGSNEPKWGCNNCILQFKRPQEADDEKVESYLEFFEPPSDSVWRL